MNYPDYLYKSAMTLTIVLGTNHDDLKYYPELYIILSLSYWFCNFSMRHAYGISDNGLTLSLDVLKESGLVDMWTSGAI
jgi:hypothetical protein